MLHIAFRFVQIILASYIPELSKIDPDKFGITLQFVNGETYNAGGYDERFNALMLTCGFYDESGEFAFRVDLPGKSGVGGGIAAVYPDGFSIVVWSPKLNENGNSA